MKKVLFVASLYHPHIGGIETMITELSQFYYRKNINSAVLTKKWPTILNDYEYFNNVKIFRVVSTKEEKEFHDLVNWLRNNNSKIKADIIHIIGVRRPLPLIGLMLGKLWKVPVITTIAGGDIPDKYDLQPLLVWEEGQEIVPQAIKQSDVINCVSEALSKDLRMLMPDISDKVRTLYAGIDLSMIKKVKAERIREQFIFSLRRLDPSKGIDILIKAFNLVERKFPELHLVIAGEGPEELKLRKMVNEYHLNKKVAFLGSVNIKRGVALLKGAALTAVPSVSEGGGLVNIEAQASGCPVIASRVGGIPEYVKDGKSGILFDSGNYGELAEKIESVLTNNNLRRKIIQGGYRHAKLFGWNVLAPKYIKLYLKSIKEYNHDSVFEPWSKLTSKLWLRLKKQHQLRNLKIRTDNN